MSNLEIREFGQAIINFMNKSTLPIEVKRLVLTDILRQTEEAADKETSAELSRRREQEAENADSGKEEEDKNSDCNKEGDGGA